MTKRLWQSASVASVLTMLTALWPAHAQDGAVRPAIQVAQLSLTDPAEYRRREALRHAAEEAERRRYLEARAQQAREQEERSREYERQRAEMYRRRDAEIEEQSRRNREYDERQRVMHERMEAEYQQSRLRGEIDSLRYRLSLERQQYDAPAPVFQPPAPPNSWTPPPVIQTQPTPRRPQPVVALSGSYPSSGAVFRDRLSDGNDCPECPELVVIPAGTYIMGANVEEERRENLPPDLRGRALPQTRVSLAQDFAVARTEVTRAQYAAFVAATGRTQPGGCIVYRRSPASSALEWRLDTGATWNAPGFTQSDRDPVVCVSHADAQAYVQWLSDQTGYRYRLLSEAEWEYAARAGTRTPRWWSGGAGDACVYANVADRDAAQALDLVQSQGNIHPCNDRYASTAPAGSFAANRFGLNDMLGNVWEWTEDCWNDNYSGRPADAQAWMSGNCQRRVIRGGAWNDMPMVVRSGFRDWVEVGARSNVIGFRVARELAGAPQVSARLPR